jgi:hypothetical protein
MSIVISGESITTVAVWIGVTFWFIFTGVLFYASKVSYDDRDYEYTIVFVLGGIFILAIGVFILLLVTGELVIK